MKHTIATMLCMLGIMVLAAGSVHAAAADAQGMAKTQQQEAQTGAPGRDSMIDEDTCRTLIREARHVQKHAYAPYSKFTVGAALMGNDGTIYRGCNVENGSYGLTICAERNAIFQAVAAGGREFRAIAIAGDSEDFTMPCGACRQVLLEFRVPYCIVTRPDDTYEVMTLEELLPHGFAL